MRRIVGGMLAAAGLVLLAWQTGEAPPARAAAEETVREGAAAVELDSVRVQHEFLQAIPAVPVRPPSSPRLDIRRATAPAAIRKASASPLLERARRALLGDGRYRPEPFPRPD